MIALLNLALRLKNTPTIIDTQQIATLTKINIWEHHVLLLPALTAQRFNPGEGGSQLSDEGVIAKTYVGGCVVRSGIIIPCSKKRRLLCSPRTASSYNPR